MSSASARKLFALLVIVKCQLYSAQQQEVHTFDQGWRKQHTKEGRQELKSKAKMWEAERASSSGKTNERWARRDKNLGPADAVVVVEEEVGLTLCTYLLFIIVPFLLAAGACHSARSSGKLAGFNMTNIGLVQQALIVIRHGSTTGMDRALDLIETAMESVSSKVSSLGSTVRHTRRNWKKDDVDLLELKTQVNAMSDDFMANSIVAMDTNVHDIVKPAESLKKGMEWAMDELLQSVENDSDDEEMGTTGNSNLEPIDQL